MASAETHQTLGCRGAFAKPNPAMTNNAASGHRNRSNASSTRPVSSLRALIRVSRPRFWIYLLGPFMIALAATSLRPPVEVWLLGLYLTLPANLLIYGVNDLYDVDTDRLNPKKRDYENLLQPGQRRGLVIAILALNLPFLALVPFLPHAWPWLLLFVVTGVGYSMPPVRAKSRPVARRGLQHLVRGARDRRVRDPERRIAVLDGAAARAAVVHGHARLLRRARHHRRPGGRRGDRRHPLRPTTDPAAVRAGVRPRRPLWCTRRSGRSPWSPERPTSC